MCLTIHFLLPSIYYLKFDQKNQEQKKFIKITKKKNTINQIVVNRKKSITTITTTKNQVRLTLPSDENRNKQ